MTRTSMLAHPDPRPPSVRRPLAAKGGAPASRSPVALTEVSWAPRKELHLGDWVRQGHWLGVLTRASGWWLGDWLRYGNTRYGERYRAASAITGYDVQTLMNQAYVASRFEISRRREKLSFSHHAELAALPADEQDRWLGRAERAGLSVRALRAEVRRESRSTRNGEQCGGEDGGGLQSPDEVACPSCGHRFHA